jgi:hypothetical protein
VESFPLSENESSSAVLIALMMAAASTIETSVDLYQTRRYNPEDSQPTSNAVVCDVPAVLHILTGSPSLV